MRRRVTWLVAAITSAVVVAFLVPMALLLRTLAEDRAIAAAVTRSQILLSAAAAASATSGPDAVRAAVTGLVGDQPVGRVTLVLCSATTRTALGGPDVAERLRHHVTSLERTVDAIVHDARRPSRSKQMAPPSCDVGRVVGERVSFWSALAEDQGRPLRLALPDRSLRARLDAADLADVVDVLIDNVFAHTDDGVPVEIWVVPRADGAVVLTVEDAGPGLPSVDVINRGTSNAGSTGLGLDIVRRAALASGGSLELGRSRLGGALIRLVLGRADD